jgi:hypothetical protein
MSLTKTHYCDILLNMSQRNAHYNQRLISPSLKLPKAILSSDLGNRHTQQNAPCQGAFIEKCGTVRGQIKSPLMEKSFSPMATDITPPPPMRQAIILTI